MILAHVGGAPPRSTGAPGDQTCSQTNCHVGTTVNSSNGAVQISWSGGTSYVPGQRGKFTIRITDTAGRSAYGFQATARLGSNLQNGQAGTFHAGANQLIECDGGTPLPCRDTAPVQFITHSMPSGTPAFEVDWTPPATDVGEVRIYVAGNAANGNGQNTGDRIYTANITLTPASGTPANRPAISARGVTDAFNFQEGVAENTWIALFGQNLSTETRTWDGSPELGRGELPVTLAGVSVTIAGKPAAIYAVSPGQVNVLAPLDANLGDMPVVIRNANGESAPVTARKVALLPGFYAPFSQNSRLFVTGVENSTGAILGKPGVEPRAARAFRPGDIVQFYANGLGPTNPAVPANQFIRTPAPVVNQPAIRINDIPVEIFGAVIVNSGLYQVNARIPDVPDGDHPIVIEVGGTRSATNVSITIQR
jgi:uncharacterized protein (TIGR03437 family)